MYSINMSSIHMSSINVSSVTLRHLPLVAAGLLILASSALAADLPRFKGPPAFVAPPLPSVWTGCYGGVNIGYGWQKNHAYDPAFTTDTGSDTGGGVLGGGQLGCDYQLGAFVVGVQGRFDGSGVSGRHRYLAGTPGDVLATNTNWYAAETARIGYAVLPRALAYIKGGVAEARINYTDIDTTIPY